jgi:hypothetical protein
MSLLASVSVADIRARGTITEADVANFRRAFYADGVIDETEAQALCDLHHMPGEKVATWTDCYVEMLTDYLVQQAKPEGYLTLAQAEWLVGQIAPQGAIESRAELELLINVLDKARWSPQSLVAFTLDQIRHAVVENAGPLRVGRSLAAGTIDETEVELIKRVLYAYGGDGNIAITRPEAELLFEIDTATQTGVNAESWPDLFVKAIANCVMSSSGYGPPSREQALAREAWLQRRGEATLSGIFAAYRAQSPEQRAIASLERQKTEIVTEEEVSVAHAQWLAERIGRDGNISKNEQALIDLLVAESPELAPEFEILANRIAATAKVA